MSGEISFEKKNKNMFVFFLAKLSSWLRFQQQCSNSGHGKKGVIVFWGAILRRNVYSRKHLCHAPLAGNVGIYIFPLPVSLSLLWWLSLHALQTIQSSTAALSSVKAKGSFFAIFFLQIWKTKPKQSAKGNVSVLGRVYATAVSYLINALPKQVSAFTSF